MPTILVAFYYVCIAIQFEDVTTQRATKHASLATAPVQLTKLYDRYVQVSDGNIKDLTCITVQYKAYSIFTLQTMFQLFKYFNNLALTALLHAVIKLHIINNQKFCEQAQLAMQALINA